jgi:hypothetical protein
MAQINNPNLTAELEELVNASFGTTLDTDQLLNIVNKYIKDPAQRLARGVGIVAGIYKRFGEFDKIEAKSEVVTAGLWYGDVATITPVEITNPAQPAGTYYKNMGDTADSPTEFAVAFGDVSGSADVEYRAIYSQYRSILLPPNQEKFIINGSPVDKITVINVSRSRYREKIDPGNWSIVKSGITYVDDSGKEIDDNEGKTGRVFNIVNEAIPNTPVGIFYKNLGIFVFSAEAGAPFAAATLTAAVASVTDMTSFTARRTETITTKHFFVRATNREFNYSNNPSFVKSDGSVLLSTFKSDPKVFITTIGLYNEANELVAVAKTSRPIPKSFDKEVLIRVKIDF